MSAVHRATGKTYAVKMIHRSKFRAKGPTAERMFIREITILKNLQHPNICQLHEEFYDEEAIRASVLA